MQWQSTVDPSRQMSMLTPAGRRLAANDSEGTSNIHQ